MEQQNRQYVIGMAGHIDHGKTALVEALTGTNTDRLKEEQERGITVDLGFAHLAGNITIIDVPGHERLIKNMVAGVSTIDLVLFVIAADDGIMPQTREHLDIVKLIGIRNGIFVITKIDLVEEEWLMLVEEELRELLTARGFAEAPVLHASAVSGAGIDQVRKAISENLEKLSPRRDDRIFRLPVDRVFSKPGFGTVVTGSVLSGLAKVGDTLEILPEKLSARLRGLQSHDHSVNQVESGFRAALNLAGPSPGQLYRGQMITQPGYFQPAEILNVAISVLPTSHTPLRNQMRLRIHLHTAETFARLLLPENKQLAPGEEGFAQLKLEKAVYAAFRDRFVVRQYSPQVTLGGGEVLQVNPLRFRKKYLDEFRSTLKALQSNETNERCLAVFSSSHITPQTARTIQVGIGVSAAEAEELITRLKNEGELIAVVSGSDAFYYSRRQMETIFEKLEAVLTGYHKNYPAREGMPEQELLSQAGKRFPEQAVSMAIEYGLHSGKFRRAGKSVALAAFESRLDDRQQRRLKEMEEVYRTAFFSPPVNREILQQLQMSEKEFRELVGLLRAQGRLVVVDERLHFHAEAVEGAIQILRRHFSETDKLSVPQFKDLIGSTRKHAIPLLTYLDGEGFTLRQGDVRVAGPKIGR